MSEDQLLSAIVDAAGYNGWRVHHDRRSDQALQQGHAGFPDLVLARAGVVRFIECKSERGTMSAGQKAWAHALGDLAEVVRPMNLSSVLSSLR